jgi:hypothetical protein
MRHTLNRVRGFPQVCPGQAPACVPRPTSVPRARPGRPGRPLPFHGSPCRLIRRRVADGSDAARDAANRAADPLSSLRWRNALVRDRAGERRARSFHLRMQHLRTPRSQGCPVDAALVGASSLVGTGLLPRPTGSDTLFAVQIEVPRQSTPGPQRIFQTVSGLRVHGLLEDGSPNKEFMLRSVKRSACARR